MRNLRQQVEQPLDPSYRLIAITQNQITLVDTVDYDSLSRWDWFAIWDEDTKRFYVGRKEKGRVVRMHRQIMGFPDRKDVDHRNQDSLDNRRGNLRVSSRSQNMANGEKYESNTSGYRGVNLDNRVNSWRSRITVLQKRISLGYFKDIVEAARAYDRAAILYFGEFACTNFPRTDYECHAAPVPEPVPTSLWTVSASPS